MKKQLLVATILGVACAGAASAQSYRGYDRGYGHHDGRQIDRRNCEKIRQERQITGALIGGIAGGLLGDHVAGRGVRDEGRAVGGLVGALAGAGIGAQDVDCDPVQYGSQYQRTAEYRYGSPTSYSTGIYRNHTESDRYYNREYRDVEDSDLYGSDGAEYHGKRTDLAYRQCQSVTRITYLPDGREIHEPTLACRDMQYGPWSVDTE